MAQHKLTLEQKEDIIYRWENHSESARELAADYDISVERVYQIIRGARLPMHQPHDNADYSGNGRKVIDPNPEVTVDYLLSQLEAS